MEYSLVDYGYWLLVLLLQFGFDVSVDSDDNGQAVDAGFSGFVSLAACDGERLASGRRARRVHWDFDVEDVVLDGCFHGIELGWLLVRSYERR
jgi:hypothetical protein